MIKLVLERASSKKQISCPLNLSFYALRMPPSYCSPARRLPCAQCPSKGLGDRSRFNLLDHQRAGVDEICKGMGMGMAQGMAQGKKKASRKPTENKVRLSVQNNHNGDCDCEQEQEQVHATCNRKTKGGSFK